MRYIFILTLFVYLSAPNLFGQVRDQGPTGRQDLLPVEGGSIRMKIDSTTPLHKLIARLNGNWGLLETGKAYWIGYTDDMFSIASRGNEAIEALTGFFRDSSNQNGKFGAIYTLHLIGIDRKIVGRFYEEFKNPVARKALLQLLKEPDFTYQIMELLMRDPWSSDIPYLFDILQGEAGDDACWPILNALSRYKIDLPGRIKISDSLTNLNIRLNVNNEHVLEEDFDFNAQIKEALRQFKLKYPEKIIVEEKLFEGKVTGYYKTKLSSDLSLTEFFMSTGIEYNYPFSFTDLGCKVQYYVQDGKLYFCTVATARQRLVNWWKNLPVEEKRKFNL